MKYVLRENQVECSNKMVYSLTQGKGNGFVYATCGFGKSLVIADAASRLKEPTLVLQPQKEILEQNYEKMMSYGIEGVTMYSASVGKQEHGNVTFATIQSIYKKPEEFKRYKYVLIDECHRVNPEHMDGMYGQFFRAIGNPPKVSLTGSPFRQQGKYVWEEVIRNGRVEKDQYYTTVVTPLNRIFNKSSKATGTDKFIFGSMIYKAEMHELINQGFLCEPEYVYTHTGAYDYTNLKMNGIGSNFDEDALEEFVNSPDRLKQAAQACYDYNSSCNLNLVFCSSIKQAKTLSEMCTKMGLSAGYLTGAHSKKERKLLYEKFRAGDIKHFFNVGTMTTGVDVPWLDQVTYVRPTISVDVYVQSCARCIRKDPNNPSKKARIVDVSGTSKRLGRIQTIRMDKEDGFKDVLMSEVGQLSGTPLSKFRVAKK